MRTIPKYEGTGEHSLGNQDSLAYICPRTESMSRTQLPDLGRTDMEAVVWETLKPDRKTFKRSGNSASRCKRQRMSGSQNLLPAVRPAVSLGMLYVIMCSINQHQYLQLLGAGQIKNVRIRVADALQHIIS